MAALDEPAEEAEDSAADGGDTDVERQDGAATAREAHAQELLSDDQINQVGRGAPQQAASVLLASASSAKTRSTRWGEQHRSSQAGVLLVSASPITKVLCMLGEGQASALI